MDFSGGFLLPEQKNLEVTASWTPSTPAKPVVVSPPAADGIPRSQHLQPDRLEPVNFPIGFQDADKFPQESRFLNGSMRSWSFTDHLQNTLSSEAVRTSESRIPCGSVEPHAQAIGKPTRRWTRIPLGNGAARGSNIMASSPHVGIPGEVSYGQSQSCIHRQMLVNGNSQERLLNGSYQQLLLNGKLALNPHLLSGYSQMLEEPQNGFSITYGSNNNTYFSSQARTGTTANETTFIPSAPSIPDTNKGVQDSRTFKKNEKADSNKQGMDDFSSRQQDPIHITFDQVDSMPKSMSSAWLSSQMEIQKQGKGGNHGVSFDMSNPFILAPVTPDKCNKIQNGPPPEIIDLVDDSETEGNKEPGCRVVQAEKEPTLIVSKQGVSMHADTGIVSQTIENQNQTLAESQGIDLNKTPQQKSKKKKHRPKVIREGKPARKPKEVTPKSADKVEKPSGRRKYVRRKGINSETFPTGTGDNKTVRRSVKRSLNFDSEEARGKDEYQASALTSQCNIETQDSYDGKLNSTGSIENNCTLPLSQEPGNMPHQTSRGFMFDLNNAINKVPDYFIGQQENVMVTTQSSSREIIRENLKGIVAMRSSVQIKSNSQTTMSSGLQGTHQFAPDSNKISNGYSNSLLSDDVIDDNRLQRIHNDSSQAKYSIYNKRRKENGDNEIIIQLSSIVGGEQFSSSEKLPAGHLLTFDQTGDRKKQPPKAPIQVCSFSSLMSGIGCNQVTSTSGNTLAENRQLGNMETPVMGIATPNKRKPGRPKKVQSHSVNFSPLNSELASRKGYEVASLTFEGKPTESNASTLGIVQQKILTDSQGIANSRISVRETLHSPQLPKTMVPHIDPLDLIVQKLRSLNISEELREDIAQEHPQNALVPYSGNGMIVPFESLSDPTRKRRLRAKVDLDSETNRVWMLLMGKEGAAGTEGTDKDKEKWWEEERKVFRGRVESFIARMHLVQGDRRFSPWKGSVVDSVVGVFLTQNVSDHLSSSAFMSLAARFPIRSRGKSTELNMKNSDISKESHEKTFIVLDRGMENQQQIEEAPKISSQHEEEWKAIEGIGSLERDNESALFYCSQGQDLSSNKREKESRSASSRNRIDIPLSLTGSRNLAETEDARLLEGAVSSQNSVISSQNSSDSPVLANEQTGLSLESNFEVEDLMASDSRIFMDASTSFMNLLRMAGTSEFQELYSCEHGIALNESFSREVNASEPAGSEKGPLGLYDLNKACPSTSREDSYHCHEQNDWIGVSSGSSPAFQFYYSHLNSGPLAMENAWTVRDSQSNFPSAISGISNIVYAKNCAVDGQSTENRTEIGDQEKSVLTSRNLPIIDVHTGNSVQENVTNSKSSPNCTKVSNECGMKCLLNGKTEVLQDKAAIVEAMIQMPNYRVHEPNVDLSPCVSSMHDTSFSNILEKGKDMPGMATSLNPSHAISSNEEAPKEIVSHGVKSKKVKPEKEKNTFDWDCLRKFTCNGGVTKERSGNTMDSVDWEAIRQADVTEISNTIRERGMNNMLAERIKDFLDRLVREHGSIDLEWLRDVPPDKAKDYLLSIRGLGLKSVECVRLLTLHHLAFPVDTNVGRICVRLGWVPLQPLPESLQLHLLELYPLLETIQKYLWPRLCRLDQRTLYELHYQLITFGKVFCTKSKPNCNACPMRGECRHFASAFASARLALPGPEEKSLVNSQIRVTNEPGPKPVISPVPLAQLEGNLASQRSVMNSCEPIIEEPTTPEPESLEALETEIEDAFYEDPDEIPTIKLNIKQFTQNLQDIMQENNMELQEFDMSKALVALAPQVASIPQLKLKNISRLRTEHQVYELPDSHPLLEGLDQRETDDPCPYLLAIWTPGETAQSMEPPEGSCSSQDNGKLCDMPTCFLCNSIREAQAQKVRGTLLIPCRTAMRGSFPLNGTYFQVNEVFADHCSSLNPIDVPREWIWNLPRRTVYFGTSVPTIFRGLTTEGIQHCFWRGFVCVRGFDQKTRAPRPLMARLHFPASKVTRNKRTMAREE